MLLPNDFYSMSPRHLSLMMKGYQNKKIDLYKQTRLLMFTMVRLHGDPKTAPKSPEALWQLPGDELESNGLNDNDIKEMFKRLAQ
jgi:hypothetical protein